MNRNLWLLALAQGLYLTNNVTLIAINGLVGLSLAPVAWMATLPVVGYVVGSALCTGLVARSQARFGRKVSFQLGLLVALLAAALGAAWAQTRHLPGRMLFAGLVFCVVNAMVSGDLNDNRPMFSLVGAALARWRPRLGPAGEGA